MSPRSSGRGSATSGCGRAVAAGGRRARARTDRARRPGERQGARPAPVPPAPREDELDRARASVGACSRLPERGRAAGVRRPRPARQPRRVARRLPGGSGTRSHFWARSRHTSVTRCRRRLPSDHPLRTQLALLGSRRRAPRARGLVAFGIRCEPGPRAAPLARLVSGPAGAGAGAAPKLFVHVVGAVHRPGLFRLEGGSRVADAVTRAGGPTGRADQTAPNLAAPLADGEQVLVPRRGLSGTAATGAATWERAGEPRDRDGRPARRLPGMGPVTAQKIVDCRTIPRPVPLRRRPRRDPRHRADPE